jgi:hypothetical protein
MSGNQPRHVRDALKAEVRALAAAGVDRRDICEQTGVGHQAVTAWLREDDAAVRKADDRMRQVSERVAAISRRCLECGAATVLGASARCESCRRSHPLVGTKTSDE